MRGCHNCGEPERIRQGHYRQRSWESTPCAKCDVLIREKVMAFEEGRGEGTAAEYEEEEGLSASLPVAVLVSFLRDLVRLSPVNRNIVCWRMAGWSYRQIGVWEGLSLAAVEKRLRMLMARWPELGAVFEAKRGRQ